MIKDSRGGLIAKGYNRFPPAVWISPERLARPAKYAFTEHAERIAIYEAARMGTRLEAPHRRHSMLMNQRVQTFRDSLILGGITGLVVSALLLDLMGAYMLLIAWGFKWNFHW